MNGAKMRSRKRALAKQSGLTLLELIIASSILLILSSAALPVLKFTVIRAKEAELRRDLREMRDAIDHYKDAADLNLVRVKVGSEGYPPDLETLVKGVEYSGTAGEEIPPADSDRSHDRARGMEPAIHSRRPRHDELGRK